MRKDPISRSALDKNPMPGWSGLPFPSPMHESESEVAQSCPTLVTPWTAACQASLFITNSWSLLKLTRRSSQSILKEINPEYSLEALMLKLKLQYFGNLMGQK